MEGCPEFCVVEELRREASQILVPDKEERPDGPSFSKRELGAQAASDGRGIFLYSISFCLSLAGSGLSETSTK